MVSARTRLTSRVWCLHNPVFKRQDYSRNLFAESDKPRKSYFQFAYTVYCASCCAMWKSAERQYNKIISGKDADIIKP